MIVNKYPGKCLVCSAQVKTGEGFATKRGRWMTVCASTACIERAGEPVPTGPVAKTLSADGVVRMPKPGPGGLELVRSMPGAKFDWDAKVWTVSTAPADLDRVIEVAEKLGLEVAEELREAAAAGTEDSAEAEARAGTQGLYEFQRDGVRFLALKQRALLADDMGLGKTVQALVAIPDGAPVVVVCPASVKRNWSNEVEKWRPDLTPVVLSGTKGPKSWREPKPGEVLIINYDVLPKGRTEEYTIETRRGPQKRKRVIQDLPENTVLIVDEAQMVKTHTTQRHKRVVGLAAAASRVWLLTGTPVENRPWDLKGVLEAGGMFGDVFGSFGKFLGLFGGYKNRWGGFEFSGPTDEVPERLRRVALRRMKTEVLKDLPTKQYQTLSVNGTSVALRKELDAELEVYEEMLQEGVLPPFERISEIRAKLARERIPAATQIVEEYEEAGIPLIVFSAHRDPVDAIGSREGWAKIYGGTGSEERAEIVRRFQAGELRGVALTIKAGGVGLTLTRASNELFVDRDWNPAWNVQAEDRTVRIGQTADSVLIKTLVTDHPLDRRVNELLEQKIRLFRDTVENEIAYQAPKVGPELREETQEELEARLKAAEEATERAYYGDKIQGVIERERAKGVGPEPVLTAERKALVREAFYQMIGVCDGAIEKDDVGFNKPDAAIAHWVFRFGLRDDDEVAFRLLERMLSRYKHTQLGADYAGIWNAA